MMSERSVAPDEEPDGLPHTHYRALHAKLLQELKSRGDLEISQLKTLIGKLGKKTLNESYSLSKIKDTDALYQKALEMREELEQAKKYIATLERQYEELSVAHQKEICLRTDLESERESMSTFNATFSTPNESNRFTSDAGQATSPKQPSLTKTPPDAQSANDSVNASSVSAVATTADPRRSPPSRLSGSPKMKEVTSKLPVLASPKSPRLERLSKIPKPQEEESSENESSAMSASDSRPLSLSDPHPHEISLSDLRRYFSEASIAPEDEDPAAEAAQLRVQQLEEEVAGLRETLEDYQLEIMKLTRENEELVVQLTESRSDQDSSQQRVQTYENTIQELQAELIVEREKLSHHQMEIQDLTTQLGEVDKVRSSLDLELQDMEKKRKTEQRVLKLEVEEFRNRDARNADILRQQTQVIEDLLDFCGQLNDEEAVSRARPAAGVLSCKPDVVVKYKKLVNDLRQAVVYQMDAKRELQRVIHDLVGNRDDKEFLQGALDRIANLKGSAGEIKGQIRSKLDDFINDSSTN